MKIPVLIHEAEEGGFWAEAPSLKGCYAEGESKEEVIAHIREAIQDWLEVAAESATADAGAQVAEIEV